VPADAPFRERGNKALLLLHEPGGSSWSFLWKQQLDARASFQIVVDRWAVAIMLYPWTALSMRFFVDWRLSQ
jgi:hypothetical protein